MREKIHWKIWQRSKYSEALIPAGNTGDSRTSGFDSALVFFLLHKFSVLLNQVLAVLREDE